MSKRLFSMSIKIFSIDKGQLFVFLLISALLHAGIILIASQARDGKKALPRLIPVDVIELPQPTKTEVRSQKRDGTASGLLDPCVAFSKRGKN